MRQPNIVVIGSLNMDIVVEAPRFPQVGETITGTRAHFIPGGKGGNQAVAASRLGAHTVMVGMVGDDAFGGALTQSLADNQVVTKRVTKTSDAPTGLASIMIAHDDNHIVVVPGANALCLPENIEGLEETIAAADLVLLQLEIPLETVVASAQLAKRHGKTVILNPAPAQKLPLGLMQSVDYMTPNRSELYLLTGIDPYGDGLEKAIDALLEMGPRCVVTTLGAAGSVYKESGKNLVSVPAHHVQVMDTTGAGDAFNAGLGYALSIGYELDKAVRFAGKVSALAVTRFGAQAGMPTLDEVKAFALQLLQPE
ncbi:MULTISPECIES: ribokinase [Brevibacillus]|jgi:ribokinase|uniref:ribokinase n=1 Tax=Brevibacillus TaxID=55080 RepID=UPI00046A3E82|nr:ribokinase [Brevibacillus borstelensis]KKX56454.1 ribokinase [Brevibacillus borstelensis cifa_chp40]MBE5398248.1 ribokinase [Brevibacillus borstelensis]MCC0564730.1 ribokinase [Brevibacillus borstelensis]MCM3468835.1 ribokinase [Brevibacillus borstelensis]MCM3556967.1 ribokinase [Brevibacillus borstelensis]